MKNIFNCIVLVILISLIGCSTQEIPSVLPDSSDAPEEKSSFLERITIEPSSQLLFVAGNYMVIGTPKIEEDHSYSLLIQKVCLNDFNVETMGVLDYVGLFANDYVYIDDSHIYGCFSYDSNFYSVGTNYQNKIRIVRFDIENNSVNVVSEFASSYAIIYVEPINDKTFLLYDTGIYHQEDGHLLSSIGVYDIDQQRMSTIYSKDNNAQKPLAATFSENLLYILNEQNGFYKITAYDEQMQEEFNVPLDGLTYFLNDSDGNLNSVQSINIQNNMCVITLFGDSSLVFTFEPNTTEIVEKYVGPKLIPWDMFNGEKKIKFYSSGGTSYKIDFDRNTISEILLQNKIIESSVYYTIFSSDDSQGVLYAVSVNPETTGLEKTYYFLPLISQIATEQ